MTVRVEIDGRVLNSDHPGHTVRVQDDRPVSGGYLIFEYWHGSGGPNAAGAFDSWVESESQLEGYFQEAGWEMHWGELGVEEAALVDARAIARAALAGKMNPNEACGWIADLCAKSGWPEPLVPFAALAHEQEGHDHVGFTRENTEPFILEACKSLLRAGNAA